MNRLISFDSVHQAIRAEQLLLKAGVPVEMVPTPREISASCGQSLRFPAGSADAVLALLEQEKIAFRGIYSAAEGQRIYELLVAGR
jgi:hypothetical protein